MGDAASVGRVFAKALGWFVTASLVSLLLGLLMSNLLRPGKNLGLPLPDIGASANLATSKFTLKDFVGHMVPRSFAESMANNEILQIVVFSMFFGVALAALGDKAKILVGAIDQLAHVMLKITGYVMKLAPLAGRTKSNRRRRRASTNRKPVQARRGSCRLLSLPSLRSYRLHWACFSPAPCSNSLVANLNMPHQSQAK
jgi:hypothetical protein